MTQRRKHLGIEFKPPSGRRRGVDLTGAVFGRLTVERFAGMARGDSWWWCLCECGETVPVRTHCLYVGMTTSCGCYAREVTAARHRTHGMSNKSEYRLWRGMISRCHDPKSGSYNCYGAKGIAVCERWRLSFTDFYSDIGPRPSPGHSLDRYPNNKGNYQPGNVRWATSKEQQRNKTNNNVIEFNGKSMTLVEWGESIGIPGSAISQRLTKGWSVDEALTIPYGAHRSTFRRLSVALQKPLPPPVV